MTEAGVPAVLQVSGRIDASSALDLDENLKAASRAHPSEIVVDLGGVTYISSSGLRVLLLAHKREKRAGGRLELRNPSPKVLRVMHMCGFDRVFGIVCQRADPSAQDA